MSDVSQIWKKRTDQAITTKNFIIKNPAGDHTTIELIEALHDRDPNEIKKAQKEIEEKIQKQKEKTKKLKKALAPLAKTANELQAQVDILKQKLAKATKLSEKMDLQYEIRKTLEDRDDQYKLMENVEASFK